LVDEEARTPKRTLVLGCTAFLGVDSVNWTDQVIPNLPDYDLVVVSVPHITEAFLMSVKGDYLVGLRKSFVRLLDSGGKVVVLVSAAFTVQRPSQFPDHVSNNDWSPIKYITPQEAGKSIVSRRDAYEPYLKAMSEWSFYIAIPRDCLSRELTDYFGSTSKTKYDLPLVPYLENRYGRVLAGEFRVEVRLERVRGDDLEGFRRAYSPEPDVTTGEVVLLPLVGKASPEEALARILHEEIGLSVESPEPDWARAIQMPGVAERSQRVAEARAQIERGLKLVDGLEMEIAGICSFRRLLYGTGYELEAIVKTSLEKLGATVSPSKYSQEEYILEFKGREFLMEVKGVAKGIALSHLRQLNDYLLKFQEDTGRECKGILFGNAWRNMPPEMRGTEDTQEFPDNVVRRAEQWGVSLVSSTAFFPAFVKALENPGLADDLLVKMTTSTGVASF
jgi:hypothetical protein